MSKITVITLSVAVAVGDSACSDRSPSGPGGTNLNPPPGMVVSNPRVSSGLAGSTGLRSSVAVSANTLAYVSAEPGTFPDAASVSVRNETKATTSQSVLVMDGGFDPVAVKADEGDELLLKFFNRDGGSTVRAVKVPARRKPGVVRTNPAKGRTDVALNVQVLVVFSEPVDKSSVTSSSVTLLRDGSEVSGHIEVAADGLSAEFVPDAQLQPDAAYTLVVNETIRDLDGDALGDASTVTFITQSPAPTGQLAFVLESDRQIYRINADGTGMTALTGTGRYEWAAWSPDGQRIAFSKNVPGPEYYGFGTSDIYVMNADGSNVVRRTVGANFRSIAWSPDGQKLAISDEGAYFSDLYLMSALDDGAPPTLLAADARSPAWSPDGQQIAFVRISGDDGYDHVRLIDADGTNERPLTEIGGGIFGVAWSPNGRRIAFSECSLGSCGLNVMNADGSGRSWMRFLETVSGAAWSPDGKWIATNIWSQGQPSVVYIPAAAGGNPRVIVGGGFNPSWRP